MQTNTPPQFTTNFLARGAGAEAQSYSNSIAGTAIDADAGNTLTYSKSAGPAWLNVAANGTLAGTPTSGDGGTNYFTVRVTDAAGQNAFAIVAISVTTFSASGTWIADANASWGEANRWSGGMVATGPGQTADFSTINITANRTVTLDSSRSIGTLRFGDTSGSQSWTVTNNGGSVLTLDTGSATQPSVVVTNTATISTPLAGTNGFVKNGPGMLILAANNSISGPLNLDRGIDGNNNDGITRLAHPSAVAGAASLNIRNTSVSTAGGATLQLDGSAGGIVIAQPVSVTCRNNSTTPTIQSLSGTNTFTGFVALNVGGNMFNIRSDSGLLVFAGTNQYVGTLTAGRTYAFSGTGHHLVSGPILNSVNGAPISLIKSDTGTLTLAGTNTYGGTTTVSGGTLLVNGTLPSGGLTISSGVTLGGNGVINSAVTMPSGSTLSPGAILGRLTVNNNVSLQAGSTTRMEISKAADTNDVLRPNGSLSYGGTLVVTNLAGDLAPGDSFQLFQAASYAGSFALFNLPPLSAGLLWNTTRLTNSILAVVAVPPQITAIARLSDGNFQFTGTGAAGLNYELRAATNLAPPIFWSAVTNSTADGNGFFQLLDFEATNHPQRFYRVVNP